MDDAAKRIAIAARDELLCVLVRPIAALWKSSTQAQPFATQEIEHPDLPGNALPEETGIIERIKVLVIFECALDHLLLQSSAGELAAFPVLLRRLCVGPDSSSGTSFFAEALIRVFVDALLVFASCESMQAQLCTALGGVRETAPADIQVRQSVGRWQRCVSILQ